MPNRKSSYNTNNKNNRYNYTSSAHKYDLEYNYNSKINRKVKKIKKDKYISVEQGLKVFSLKFFVIFAFLVVFIISIIFIEAYIIQKKFEIDKLNVQLKEIYENNKNIENELAKNLDLEYVEYIASTELGMQKPTSHQVVHISVPKESYSQKGQIIIDEEPSFAKFLQFLKDKIFKIDT